MVPKSECTDKDLFSKEHLELCNANANDAARLRVRRREDEELADSVITHIEQMPPAAAPVVAEAAINDGLAEQPSAPAPAPAPTPPAEHGSAPEAAQPSADPIPLSPAHDQDMRLAVSSRVLMNFKPSGSSWYGGTVDHVSGDDIYIGFDDGDMRRFTHS
eukprot:6206355-Pleurochrysis_carterae.AAC.5